MGSLDDGLADVSVPTAAVVAELRAALDDRLRAEVMRGGGRDFRAENLQRATANWLLELELAVTRR